MSPFKTCSCCQRAISAQEWTQLRLVGIQADDVETLELRDCDCGSTIAVVVPPPSTQPVPETVRPPDRILTWKDYRNYQPTVEDRLAIQEFFDDEARVFAGIQRARTISETDTRNESCPSLPTVRCLFPVWDSETPMADAWAAVGGA